MLARFLQSSCMCLSVGLSFCLPQAGIVSKRLDKSSWLLAWKLSFTYCTLRYKKLSISKYKGTSVWNFVLNSGLRKFFQGRSIVLSTKLADSRVCWRHLWRSTRRGWTHVVYYTSVDCNPLTPLHQFCSGSVLQLVPTVVQQLTRFRWTYRVVRVL